jgi:hypothetical protein
MAGFYPQGVHMLSLYLGIKLNLVSLTLKNRTFYCDNYRKIKIV